MNLIAAVTNGLAALRAGRELKNAAAWKNVQTIANFLSLLVALATALGFKPPLADATVYAAAGALAAAANVYFTLATSAKVGLLPPAKVAADEPPPITLVSRIEPDAEWMRPSAPVSPDRAISPGSDDDHGYNG